MLLKRYIVFHILLDQENEMVTQEKETKVMSFLSQRDLENGFSLIVDANDNITLLKRGSELAWYSRKADKDTVQSLIKLMIKCYE
jgi:hypothetical protein